MRISASRDSERASHGYSAAKFKLKSVPLPIPRHCERSEAIQNPSPEVVWIASSQVLLAMTC